MRSVGAHAVLGLLSALLGLLVGFGIWALLSLAYWLVDAVWGGLRGLTGGWFLFPMVVCTLGGAAIGLWNARFHSAPKPLDQVMADVKATGGYSVGRIAPSSVSFLLPIAFGGSVGPEAGLTGLIASGCTWVGERLKRASARLGVLASAAEAFPRASKLVLYPLGVAGGVAGAVLFTTLFGGGMALPRFDAIPWSVESLVWVLPLACVGCMLALLYGAATRASRWLAGKLDRHPALQPVVCGLALGAAALFLPNVLFPGSQQAVELMGTWTGLSSATLLLTGAVKTVFVALCLGLGWSGGPFFPLLFCGISFGYGIAGLTGLDPLLCVTVVATALIAGFSRKAAAAVVLVLLCFPLASLPWALAAMAMGLLLPAAGEALLKRIRKERM